MRATNKQGLQRSLWIAGCFLLCAGAVRAVQVYRDGRTPGARFGIEPIALRSTASGYLIDFRYRVTDAEKAQALFKPDLKASLKTAGGKTADLSTDDKLGALRASPRSKPEAGKQYYVLFSNRAGLQSGEKATVTLGDCTLPDLVLQ